MQDFRLEFERHAQHEWPNEACGLIVDGTYWHCRNIADDPAKDFAIDPRDYAMAALCGQIEGIVHSHPRGGAASAVDRRSCTQTNLPWYIWSMPDKKWITINP